MWRSNTPDAALDHTYSGSTCEVVLNGTKMPEAGMNAFMAGSYGVPISLPEFPRGVPGHSQRKRRV